MIIKKFNEFNESISGWELVGQHVMGPNYPEQNLPNSLSKFDTQVIMGIDGKFYTYDDYQELLNNHLKNGGDNLPDFNKENLDLLIKNTLYYRVSL